MTIAQAENSHEVMLDRVSIIYEDKKEEKKDNKKQPAP
jgi:hypothetical protein